MQDWMDGASWTPFLQVNAVTIKNHLNVMLGIMAAVSGASRKECSPVLLLNIFQSECSAGSKSREHLHTA